MQKRKKRNPYKRVLLIITLVFVIFMLSGITLSYVDENIRLGKKQVDAIVFNEGDLAINYLDGNRINLNYPTKKKYKYNFSVTNTSSSKIYYSLYIKDCYIINNNVRVRLINSNKEEVYNEKLVNGENLIQSVFLIEPNSTDRYTLIIDNKRNRSNIEGIITVENESLNRNSLQDLVLNGSLFNKEPKTNIGTKSIINEGLIKSEDDYGITYYYRGNITNNYLVINNKTFRIIRINGDGTIRAILDEPDSNVFAYNTNVDEDKAKSVALENSTIIEQLNNWVKDNLGEYENLLVASNFCSDGSIDNIRNNMRYSNTYVKLQDNTISFSCPSTNYLSKVGLITPNEVILAGGSIIEENTNFYLYNSEITDNTWTIGSYGIDKNNTLFMYSLTSTGLLTNTPITQELHIRPVINVSSNAVAKGEGSKENPFILVK